MSEPQSYELLLDAAETIRERGEQYGDATEVMGATMEMFAVYRALKGTQYDPHDTAIFNILQKVVRIGSGKDRADSWKDIAGYAALGAEVDE